MTRDVEHRIPLRIQVREPGEGAGNGRFEFTAEASNNSLDFYYTHMLESTLRNFAREAGGDGVQFLDSHNNRNLGYGRTFGGRVETDAGRKPSFDVDRAVELAIDPPAEYQRAVLDVFTIPGIRFGGGLTYASTDDFINAVRGRLARDVSVGFFGGRWTCDVCGGNYRSYQDCPHFAGVVYEVGEQGERQVLATVSIDGAHLAELSAVYDGATPGAMIEKAERMAAAGEMTAETKRLLEVRYRVNLPGRSTHAVPDLSKRGRETAESKEVSVDIETLYEDARAAVSEVGNQGLLEDDEMQPGAAIRHLASEGLRLRDEVKRLEAETERLAPLADDGRTYRADLVAEALAEGVRAHGDGFSEETYRQILEDAPLETIKRMRADWKAIGDKRFPGGRQTVDGEEGTPAGEARQVVPDEAYSA